ncbi:MAG: hypothetical protein PVF05_04250 [Gemmatimonadales bacterium]|jgi:hypothetical protein
MTETDAPDHLTDLQVYELASEEAVDPAVAAHAASCAACGANLRQTRDLLGAIARTTPGLEPRGELGLELQRRIRADRHRPFAARVRVLAGTAAAVICFVAGVATHALWTGPETRSASSPVPDAPTPALAIQRAGTEYVAAIANLADDVAGLTTEDVRTGREVALAAMSGAAFELRRLGDPNPETSEIRRLVEDAWRRTSEERGP